MSRKVFSTVSGHRNHLRRPLSPLFPSLSSEGVDQEPLAVLVSETESDWQERSQEETGKKESQVPWSEALYTVSGFSHGRNGGHSKLFQGVFSPFILC